MNIVHFKKEVFFIDNIGQVKSSQSMRNLNSGLDLRKYISTANNSRK